MCCIPTNPPDFSPGTDVEQAWREASDNWKCLAIVADYRRQNLSMRLKKPTFIDSGKGAAALDQLVNVKEVKA